jgi:hypothetical protein
LTYITDKASTDMTEAFMMFEAGCAAYEASVIT